MKLYLSGSLRNPRIPAIANIIEARTGCQVFADWFGAGERADDSWQAYEKARGREYTAALRGYAAQHIFAFDKHHLDTADAFVLLCPAGKSSHIELGYMVGKGKPAWVLLDGEPERWDQMLQFATSVVLNVEALVWEIKKWQDAQ